MSMRIFKAAATPRHSARELRRLGSHYRGAAWLLHLHRRPRGRGLDAACAVLQFWYPSDYCAQRSVSFDKIFLVLSKYSWVGSFFASSRIYFLFARARVPSSGTFSSGEFYSKRKIIIASFAAAAACVYDSESPESLGLGVRPRASMSFVSWNPCILG